MLELELELDELPLSVPDELLSEVPLDELPHAANDKVISATNNTATNFFMLNPPL